MLTTVLMKKETEINKVIIEDKINDEWSIKVTLREGTQELELDLTNSGEGMKVFAADLVACAAFLQHCAKRAEELSKL